MSLLCRSTLTIVFPCLTHIQTPYNVASSEDYCVVCPQYQHNQSVWALGSFISGFLSVWVALEVWNFKGAKDELEKCTDNAELSRKAVNEIIESTIYLIVFSILNAISNTFELGEKVMSACNCKLSVFNPCLYGVKFAYDIACCVLVVLGLNHLNPDVLATFGCTSVKMAASAILTEIDGKYRDVLIKTICAAVLNFILLIIMGIFRMCYRKAYWVADKLDNVRQHASL
jgi:hypothetical protein